jgi:hypothetical protein
MLVALGGAVGFLAAFGTLCAAFLLFWFAAMLNGVVRMNRNHELLMKVVSEQQRVIAQHAAPALTPGEPRPLLGDRPA